MVAVLGPDDPVEAVVLGVDESQVGSLVDALDDLPPSGEGDPLSAEGRRRLEALRDELRALRRRTDQPLPDLVADVERTLLLDVEVSARSADPAAARADLDAFADAAASFAGDTSQDGAGEAVLTAFLAHLSAAEDEEHGLDTGAVSGADTVKLMTVHAAKGLEWPVVAVPGLARSTTGGAAVFPAKPSASTSWTSRRRTGTRFSRYVDSPSRRSLRITAATCEPKTPRRTCASSTAISSRLRRKSAQASWLGRMPTFSMSGLVSRTFARRLMPERRAWGVSPS